MSRWGDYFERWRREYGTWVNYVFQGWDYNRSLFKREKYLTRHVPAGGTILELGCGSALTSMALDGLGYKVTVVENDPDVIRFVQESKKRLGSAITIVKKDLFKMDVKKKYDLCFSSGVVEHFDEEKTINALKAHARYGKKVVIMIPTKHTKNLTDERLYTAGQLGKLCERAGMKVIDSFAYGNVEFHNILEAGFFCYLLPPIVYALIQKWFGYATNIGIVCASEK